MTNKKWINGKDGNRASVEYWGSKEKAEESLKTLTRCSDCSDCSRCSDCSDCSDCSRCSDCSDCSRCSGCSDCSRCSGCSDCSRCSRCSGCSDMSPQKTAPMEIPRIENIHHAVYAAATQPGALDMGDFESPCKTTHCRAGFAVVLAGEAGIALRDKTSWIFAAMQIYKASGYEISPVRFFDSDNDALADMKRLAEAEQAAASK